MEEEFNLSKREKNGFYSKKDVKEFIKILKEMINSESKKIDNSSCMMCYYLIKNINKIVGSKLR